MLLAKEFDVCGALIIPPCLALDSAKFVSQARFLGRVLAELPFSWEVGI